MKSNEVIAAEDYLYKRYPASRYQFKNLYTIPDVFGDEHATLYVIEFTDSKLSRSKPLELLITATELFNSKMVQSCS